MKILLFGHRGQVGSALKRALQSTHSLIAPDIDMTDDIELRDIIIRTAPDIIINAAAHTNVDNAEDNHQQTFHANAHAPRIMAEMAHQNDIQLIHYSTDYVFNGDGVRPWVETDAPKPINIYGQSKSEGEQYIIESGCRHLIFRTSWIYDMVHDNFVTKILQLSRERENMNVVSDQIGAPTSARFIAKATSLAIRQQNKAGIYHLCCKGETSWFEFAKLIVKTQNPTSKCLITPILSKNYPQKAHRPLNSRLNCDKFISDFIMSPPNWATEYLETRREFSQNPE